jgi:hypothetical protein
MRTSTMRMGLAVVMTSLAVVMTSLAVVMTSAGVLQIGPEALVPGFPGRSAPAAQGGVAGR